MSILRIARNTALALGFFLPFAIGAASFAGAEEAESDRAASSRKSYMPPERHFGEITGRQPARARIIKVAPRATSDRPESVVLTDKQKRERYPAAGLPVVIRPTSSLLSRRTHRGQRPGPRVITVLPGVQPGVHPRVITGLPGSRLPHSQRVITGLPGVKPGVHPRVITGLPESRVPLSRRVVTGLPRAVPGKGPRVITGLPGSRLPRSQRVITGLPGNRLPRSQRVITGLPGVKPGVHPRVITGLPRTSLTPGHRPATGLPGRRTRRSHRGNTGLTASRTRRTTRTPTGLPKTRVHGHQRSVTKHGQTRVTRHGTRGKATRGLRHSHGVRIHFPFVSAYALPEQRLYPPYYRASQPWTHRPDLNRRLESSLTVRQGSPLRGHIRSGKTVEQGAITRSHIKGGRTSRKGSPLRSHIVAGRTVRQGSRWSSSMRNWTFRGYQAPMRPKGITYYRTR